MPTAKQAVKCCFICQQITGMYLPIYLVRLDERTNDIFILAGENTQILIDAKGDVTIL